LATRFKAPTHVQDLAVFPLHEPDRDRAPSGSVAAAMLFESAHACFHRLATRRLLRMVCDTAALPLRGGSTCQRTFRRTWRLSMNRMLVDCGGRAQRRHRFGRSSPIPKAAWRFASRRSPQGSWSRLACNPWRFPLPPEPVMTLMTAEQVACCSHVCRPLPTFIYVALSEGGR